MPGYEIPLTGVPEVFTIALAGTTYTMTLQWRDAANGGWVLDIADAKANPLVSGVALTTGADLLAPFPDLAIGGSLQIINTDGTDAAPTFGNLGTDSHLIFTAP